MRCILLALGFRVTGAPAGSLSPLPATPWAVHICANYTLVHGATNHPDEAVLMVGNWLWVVGKARIQVEIHEPLVYESFVFRPGI